MHAPQPLLPPRLLVILTALGYLFRPGFIVQRLGHLKMRWCVNAFCVLLTRKKGQWGTMDVVGKDVGEEVLRQ